MTCTEHRVNPVVTFAGQGTLLLFGDKTALTSTICIRQNQRKKTVHRPRERQYATAAAKAQLFEFNDAFTRAQFREQLLNLS